MSLTTFDTDNNFNHEMCTIFRKIDTQMDVLNKTEPTEKIIGIVCDPNFSMLHNVDSLQYVYMYTNHRYLGAPRASDLHQDFSISINKMRHMLGGTGDNIAKIIMCLIFVILLVVIVCVLVMLFVNIRNKQHCENSSHSPHYVH